MTQVLARAKSALFTFASSRGFLDPLTGLQPNSERALSSLLCLYAQRGEIRWEKVPLYNPESFSTVKYAAKLITSTGVFVAEYPLLHRNLDEERIWGWMPADLICLSAELRSVVMFENKIGSDFQYEPTPDTSQLARQLDYLISLRRRSLWEPALVLIRGRELFNAGWYKTELTEALKHNDRHTDVSGYLMFWEDVFDAKSS